MTVQELNTIFGENVKNYRKSRGWSQAFLADKLDLNVNSICEIETGKNFAKAENLINLATAFEIEVYELFKPPNILPDNAKGILNQYSTMVKEAMDKIQNECLNKIV